MTKRVGFWTSQARKMNMDSIVEADAPTTVKERIDSALEMLSNFGTRNDKSISRADVLGRISA